MVSQSGFKPSESSIARRIIVSGRVQGVGFRYSLAERARQLNVQGWCRNLPDGRVEAMVQGSKDGVDMLLDWAQQGPPQAVVEHMEVENQAVLEPLLSESIETFEIRR